MVRAIPLGATSGMLHWKIDGTMKQAWHVRESTENVVGIPLSRVLPWLSFLWGALFACQTLSADAPRMEIDPSAIEREASDLARQFVEASVDCARLSAGNDFLASELQRLKALEKGDSSGAELVRNLACVDAEMRTTVADVLQENADVLALDSSEAVQKMVEQADAAREAWIATRRDLDRTELLLFEIRGSGRVAGQLASLLSVDKRWFWLCGMIAVATLLGVVCHDRRHEFRKMLNGGRPKAMGLSKVLAVLLLLLASMTVITFVNGDRIYQALLSASSGEEESPRRRLEQEIATLQAEREDLEETRAELATEHEAQQEFWHRHLTDNLPARNRLPQRWQELRDNVRNTTETLALLTTVEGGLRTDQASLASKGEQLRSQESATRWYLTLRRWIRGLLGAALLALTAAGGVWYRMGVLRRQNLTSNTCPLCLGQGSLQPEERIEGEGPDLQGVRCTNVVSQEPYEECDFSFKEAYRAMTKQCFPTLGIPQAGKTHWLAMLYWSLSQGNYPKMVEFERVRSQSSENFDRIVEEILYSRIGTAATQQDRIPHPLVFNFRDHDRLGRSNVLLNIFDYSGEVTSEMDATDYRRRRALEGDGFLFFLDPTYPSEVQAKALADFREDLRLIKGVKAGRRLRTPVALCLSKIDLLAGHDYRLEDGSDAVARFYEDLSRIDPTGESTRRAVLEERSRLTSHLRRVIWPDWQIERQIDDLFGGRYAFFPLTPVGLDGRGESDLSLRTISPFGLLEPLLWLLEMTGYPVLQ